MLDRWRRVGSVGRSTRPHQLVSRSRRAQSPRGCARLTSGDGGFCSESVRLPYGHHDHAGGFRRVGRDSFWGPAFTHAGDGAAHGPSCKSPVPSPPAKLSPNRLARPRTHSRPSSADVSSASVVANPRARGRAGLSTSALSLRSGAPWPFGGGGGGGWRCLSRGA